MVAASGDGHYSGPAAGTKTMPGSQKQQTLKLLLAPMIVGALFFLLANQVAAQDQMTVYDKYEKVVDRAEAAYLRGDYFAMAKAVKSLREYELEAVPSYEFLFFEAVLSGRDNRRSEAEAKLKSYGRLLDLDEGVAKCGEGNQIVYSEKIEVDPIAHGMMCSEIYDGVIGSPSPELKTTIARYRGYVQRELNALN